MFNGQDLFLIILQESEGIMLLEDELNKLLMNCEQVQKLECLLFELKPQQQEY